MSNLNYGLSKFLQNKKVKAKKVINAFLKSEGISKFNYNTQRGYKASIYIQNNWDKFARFVDYGIKTGLFDGNPRPIKKGYWNQVKEDKRKRRKEWESLSEDEKKLFKFLQKKDPYLSKYCQFLHKKQDKVPGHNDKALSKAGRWLPKIQFIIECNYTEELIEYIKPKSLNLLENEFELIKDIKSIDFNDWQIDSECTFGYIHYNGWCIINLNVNNGDQIFTPKGGGSDIIIKYNNKYYSGYYDEGDYYFGRDTEDIYDRVDLDKEEIKKLNKELTRLNCNLVRMVNF